MSETFHRTVAEAELDESAVLPFVLNGWPVALCRSGGAVHAVVDRCTHANSPLSTGRIRRGAIMCPLHGARFDLASGKCIGGPYQGIRIFPVRVTDGWLEVSVPDDPPDPRTAPGIGGI